MDNNSKKPIEDSSYKYWIRGYNSAVDKTPYEIMVHMNNKRDNFYKYTKATYNYSFVNNFSPIGKLSDDPGLIVNNLYATYIDSREDIEGDEKERLKTNMHNFIYNVCSRPFVEEEDKYKYKVEIRNGKLYSNNKILDSNELFNNENTYNCNLDEIYKELKSFKESEIFKKDINNHNFNLLSFLNSYMKKMKSSCFILDENNDIYITPFVPFVKNHNFITHNKPVKAAGMIKVIDGKIDSIIGYSGHYIPKKSSTFLFMEKLVELNELDEGFEVNLTNSEKIENLFTFKFQDYEIERGDKGLRYLEVLDSGDIGYSDFTKSFYDNRIKKQNKGCCSVM